MTPCERVLTALRCGEPDRVPYCELGVDRALAEKLAGWGEGASQRANLESNTFSITEARELAGLVGLDNISYSLRAPVLAEKLPGRDGRLFYGPGQVHTEADLESLKLPDPEGPDLYAEAAAFAEGKGDYPAWFLTRMGIFPTMLSLGLEGFSLALYENRPLVENLLDRYCDWTCAVAEKVGTLGFDVFVTTDDMAFKTAPFFSQAIFRDLVLPRYVRLARCVSLPWVIHSDGNMDPFLEDLMDLGISGFHPCEKGAMDIQAVKEKAAGRMCVLGNVDLNLLGLGTREEVDAEVEDLIRRVGPGGGYIVTSGNSLAGYLEPENVRAMAQAVRRYGSYPIAS